GRVTSTDSALVSRDMVGRSCSRRGKLGNHRARHVSNRPGGTTKCGRGQGDPVSSGKWVAVIGQGGVAGGSWCCESGELLEVHSCPCQCWLPHDPGLRMRSSSWAAVSSMRVASTSATRAVAIQYRGVRQTFHRSAYSAC